MIICDDNYDQHGIINHLSMPKSESGGDRASNKLEKFICPANPAYGLTYNPEQIKHLFRCITNDHHHNHHHDRHNCHHEHHLSIPMLRWGTTSSSSLSRRCLNKKTMIISSWSRSFMIFMTNTADKNDDNDCLRTMPTITAYSPPVDWRMALKQFLH